MAPRVGTRWLCGALLTGCLGGFDPVDAAYVIRLKNGNEYVTTRYWEAGSQVFFDTYGGTFGVERAFITRIEKTDQLIRLATTREQPVDKAQSDGTLPDKHSVQGKPAKAAAETNSDKKPGSADPIVSEFDRLKQKTNEVNGMLTSEIRDLLREITAFKNKLSKDSKLFIEYGREFNDAHEIGSVVENALRSRTQ